MPVPDLVELAYGLYPGAEFFSAEYGPDDYGEWVAQSNGDPVPAPLAIYIQDSSCDPSPPVRGRDISSSRKPLALEQELRLQGALCDADRRPLPVRRRHPRRRRPHRPRGAQRRAGDPELLRARHAPAFQFHDVVHTARRARPSVGERLDHRVAALGDLLAEIDRRGAGEGRLAKPLDPGAALGQAPGQAVEEDVAARLRDVEQADRLAGDVGEPAGKIRDHRRRLERGPGQVRRDDLRERR